MSLYYQSRADRVRTWFLRMFKSRYVEQIERDLELARAEKREAGFRADRRIAELNEALRQADLQARAREIEFANDLEYKLLCETARGNAEVARIEKLCDYFRGRAERLELLLHPDPVVHSRTEKAKTGSAPIVGGRKTWQQVVDDHMAKEFAPEAIESDQKQREARRGHKQRTEIRQPGDAAAS